MSNMSHNGYDIDEMCREYHHDCQHCPCEGACDREMEYFASINKRNADLASEKLEEKFILALEISLNDTN